MYKLNNSFMSITLQKTQKLLAAFETNGDKERFHSLSSFRRNVYGFNILINVMLSHLSNESHDICTKERLAKKVGSLASRATIINFINDQINTGTLIANNCSDDRRVKIITPSSNLARDYENWLKSLSLFNNKSFS